jgi:hypothetical protein
MDEHQVIDLLGEPDEINNERILSLSWRCWLCDTVYEFAEPVKAPAPCERCGCIGFETIESANASGAGG